MQKILPIIGDRQLSILYYTKDFHQAAMTLSIKSSKLFIHTLKTALSETPDDIFELTTRWS